MEMTISQVIETLIDLKEYYSTLPDYYGYEVEPMNQFDKQAIDTAIAVLREHESNEEQNANRQSD